MIRIEETNYSQVIPLLLRTPNTTPTNAWGIVEKYIKGNILSNTIHNPSAVLMETDNGTYCLAGEPSNSFIDTFRAYYDEKKGKRFTLFSPNKCWDNVIEGIMTSDTKKMERKILKLNTKTFAEKVDTIKKPGDFKIHPITRDAITISNNFNEAYYHAHWGSVEHFLTYGIGYYATNSNGEILGECTAIFMNSDKANIDIYTTEKARGQGIAFHLSRLFIYKCLEKGITPIWDCDTLNTPSVNLAKKLGFEPLAVYHLYYKGISS